MQFCLVVSFRSEDSFSGFCHSDAVVIKQRGWHGCRGGTTLGLCVAGTRAAARTTPPTSSTSSTPRRARACSTAGRTCWATCSRWGRHTVLSPDGRRKPQPSRSLPVASHLLVADGAATARACRLCSHRSTSLYLEMARSCASSSLFGAEFLHLGTLAILSWKTFCGGSVCRRMA